MPHFPTGSYVLFDNLDKNARFVMNALLQYDTESKQTGMYMKYLYISTSSGEVLLDMWELNLLEIESGLNVILEWGTPKIKYSFDDALSEKSVTLNGIAGTWKEQMPKLEKSKKLRNVVFATEEVKILKKIGIRDESILCAGWLHDTIEDTDTDYDDINKDFGIETANIVATVTKDTRMIKEYREIAYCKQLKEGTWQAQIVKFADILANLNDLKSSNGTNSERKEKAKNKLKYYDAIKIGLTKNKLNIPSLDSTLSDLTKVFLKYEIKI